MCRLPIKTTEARRRPANSCYQFYVREEMPAFFLLGAQIPDIAGMRLDVERHPRDRNAIAPEALNLVRIVGEQAHLADAEVADDLRADAVVAQVLLETQLQIGLDRI